MRKEDFTLFFSLPLDDLDWSNLDASNVRRVMLPLPFCDKDTLYRLNSRGVRLVIRVPEDTYYTPDMPFDIRAKVRAISRQIGLSAVVVGNEPDNAFSFEYGSPSWGQEHAYEHREAYDRVRDLLQRDGFVVVSPALTMRSISEDEPAQPGQWTWGEILRLSYDKANYNSLHIYTYNWLGPIDESRVKWAIKNGEGMWHKEIYLDEVGVSAHIGDVEKMKVYISIADMLLRHNLGKRIVSYCPFVANGNPGNPPAYDPAFVIRDPAAYTLLGAWMTR